MTYEERLNEIHNRFALLFEMEAPKANEKYRSEISYVGTHLYRILAEHNLINMHDAVTNVVCMEQIKGLISTFAAAIMCSEEGDDAQ